MHEIASQRRVALGLVAAALLVGTLAGPAFAADTVVVAITGSGLTASVADLSLTSVPYQNTAHDVTGTMALTVDDSTGLAAGWNVTFQSSAFVWVGTVEAPAQAVDGGGALPGLIDVIQEGGTSLALLVVVLVAGTLLTIGAALLIHRGRRGSRGVNR